MTYSKTKERKRDHFRGKHSMWYTVESQQIFERWKIDGGVVTESQNTGSQSLQSVRDAKKKANQFTWQKTWKLVFKTSQHWNRKGWDEQREMAKDQHNKRQGDLSTQLLFFTLCSQTTFSQPELCETGAMFLLWRNGAS